MTWNHPTALSRTSSLSDLDVLARRVAKLLAEAGWEELATFERAAVSVDSDDPTVTAGLHALASVAGAFMGRVRSAEQDRAAAALMEREPVRRVATQLRRAPVKPSVVAEATGMDAGQVSRILRDLRLAGLAVGWQTGRTRPHSLTPRGQALLEQVQDQEQRGGEQQLLNVELAKIELEEAIDQLAGLGDKGDPLKVYVMGAAIEVARSLLRQPSEAWTPEEHLLARLIRRCPLQDTDDDNDEKYLQAVTRAWPGDPNDPRLQLVACLYDEQLVANREQVEQRIAELGPLLLDQGVSPWTDLWVSTTVQLCSRDGTPPVRHAEELVRHLEKSSCLAPPVRHALLARVEASLGRTLSNRPPRSRARRATDALLPASIVDAARADLASLTEHEGVYQARSELTVMLRKWLAGVDQMPNSLLTVFPTESVAQSDLDWLWTHRDTLKQQLDGYIQHEGHKRALERLGVTLKNAARDDRLAGGRRRRELELEVLQGLSRGESQLSALDADQFRAFAREAPAPLVVVRSLMGG